MKKKDTDQEKKKLAKRRHRDSQIMRGIPKRSKEARIRERANRALRDQMRKRRAAAKELEMSRMNASPPTSAPRCARDGHGGPSVNPALLGLVGGAIPYFARPSGDP